MANAIALTQSPATLLPTTTSGSIGVSSASADVPTSAVAQTVREDRGYVPEYVAEARDTQVISRTRACAGTAGVDYIPNPLLLRSRKFDLRIYVLVTRCDPALRVYLFRDGLCRLCTEDYCSPDTGNMACLTDRCAHLTNYSVNKLSDKLYDKPSNKNLWAKNHVKTGGKHVHYFLAEIVSHACGEEVRSREPYSQKLPVAARR